MSPPASTVLLRGAHLVPDRVVIPAGVVALWCCDPPSLLDLIQRDRPACVLVDGGQATAALIKAIRRSASAGATLVQVGPACSGDFDAAIAPSRALAEDTAAIIRSALGQPQRASVRISTPEQLRIAFIGETDLDLPVRDLSESGVCIGPLAAMPSERPQALQVWLGGDPPIALQVQMVRSFQSDEGGFAAFQFHDLTHAHRAMLRCFVRRVRLPPALEPQAPCARTRAAGGAPSLVGKSPLILQVVRTIERIAPTDATILILGETGTGKELAARAIHAHSNRAGRAFVPVNCAALPENLVESELFGHEPGSFTGAIKRRVGYIEQASGGTLFLDEIGDLPAAAQAKLLRALQERTIYRVGSSEGLRVDIRLVAATNHDLNADIGARLFRKDLFFRLNVVRIQLPALRDHAEDIPLLADHFLPRIQDRMGKTGLSMSEEALELLARYPWPGNVRELENLCTRVVALGESGQAIGPDLLDLFPTEEVPNSPVPATDLHGILDFCEREIVQLALGRNQGNRTRTARALGISRQSLQQRLARFRADSSERI
jgi:DNA-binding NtrC family response regulator